MKVQSLIRCVRVVFWITLSVFHGFGQSLGEVARKEAERRKNLEQQGASARVIRDSEAAQLGVGGNLGIFSRPPGDRPQSRLPSDRERGSPAAYRQRVQKLDREIRQVEGNLAEVRARARRERWAPQRGGRLSGRAGEGASQERLQSQIRSLETKLRQLRQDRSESYSAGRKAGFLPGELDGKGIIP